MATTSNSHSDIRRLDAEGLYEEEVDRARKQPIEDKIFAGIDLFEMACEFTLGGIRSDYPDASEDRVLAILRERLAWARQLEDGE